MRRIPLRLTAVLMTLLFLMSAMASGVCGVLCGTGACPLCPTNETKIAEPAPQQNGESHDCCKSKKNAEIGTVVDHPAKKGCCSMAAVPATKAHQPVALTSLDHPDAVILIASVEIDAPLIVERDVFFHDGSLNPPIPTNRHTPSRAPPVNG